MIVRLLDIDGDGSVDALDSNVSGRMSTADTAMQEFTYWQYIGKELDLGEIAGGPGNLAPGSEAEEANRQQAGGGMIG